MLSLHCERTLEKAPSLTQTEGREMILAAGNSLIPPPPL
jgi:hypothetical protein